MSGVDHSCTASTLAASILRFLADKMKQPSLELPQHADVSEREITGYQDI